MTKNKEQYINKSAVVAEIERRLKEYGWCNRTEEEEEESV